MPTRTGNKGSIGVVEGGQDDSFENLIKLKNGEIALIYVKSTGASVYRRVNLRDM